MQNPPRSWDCLRFRANRKAAGHSSVSAPHLVDPTLPNAGCSATTRKPLARIRPYGSTATREGGNFFSIFCCIKLHLKKALLSE